MDTYRTTEEVKSIQYAWAKNIVKRLKYNKKYLVFLAKLSLFFVGTTIYTFFFGPVVGAAKPESIIINYIVAPIILLVSITIISMVSWLIYSILVSFIVHVTSDPDDDRKNIIKREMILNAKFKTIRSVLDVAFGSHPTEPPGSDAGAGRRE